MSPSDTTTGTPVSTSRRRGSNLALHAATGVIAAAIIGACAVPTMTRTPTPEAVADLAPTGKLRAAINFGNPVLATRDPRSGDARGVSVDIARELARRLGIPLELVTFAAAGKVVEAVGDKKWDVAFLAIDPERAQEMDYTAAYVVIEGAYLVPKGSPIRSNEEVDRDGVRVAVGAGSAYDLYLTREIKRATLVRAPSSPMVVDTMLAQSLEVAAGVKQQLEADAKRVGGVQLLAGRFMVINQAMATPRGRASGARYLAAFVEDMKASGFVAEALRRHGIEGAAVAPLSTN
jgi:polar amino acid transport system substrate-binding protein